MIDSTASRLRTFLSALAATALLAISGSPVTASIPEPNPVPTAVAAFDCDTDCLAQYGVCKFAAAALLGIVDDFCMPYYEGCMYGCTL